MANFTSTATVSTSVHNLLVASSVLDTRTRPLYAPNVSFTGNPPLDVPIFIPSKTISGTVYTLSGAPASGATVKLFRQSDDRMVQTGVTDGSGHYLFVRDTGDLYTYYVLAYTSATSPQIHGVSDRGGVPA